MKPICILFIFIGVIACSETSNSIEMPEAASFVEEIESTVPITAFNIEDIILEKELLFDKYTLDDRYKYRDTFRIVQWDKIKRALFYADSLQLGIHQWAVLQNYRNKNGEATLVKEYHKNKYNLIADNYGVSRYQSVPLYLVEDSVTPVRYGRDGSLVRIVDSGEKQMRVQTIDFPGEWNVPSRYVKILPDTVAFYHVIVVDVTNQNIVSLEKLHGKWLARSINPATTGLARPPYQHETPKGTYLLQEKKEKMFFLKDGTNTIAGFSPYASRFTNGAYVHGVPVNYPRETFIEYSASLGTTPRSHMCVRNATSHAKFIYDWAPPQETLIFVID